MLTLRPASVAIAAPKQPSPVPSLAAAPVTRCSECNNVRSDLADYVGKGVAPRSVCRDCYTILSRNDNYPTVIRRDESDAAAPPKAASTPTAPTAAAAPRMEPVVTKVERNATVRHNEVSADDSFVLDPSWVREKCVCGMALKKNWARCPSCARCVCGEAIESPQWQRCPQCDRRLNRRVHHFIWKFFFFFFNY